MESIPLWAHLVALVVLLLLSAFFSIAETSMMALNRYRLSHLAKLGQRSARLTASLLKQTERLLSTILLGNNVLNTAMTAIVTSVAIRYFGNNDTVLLVATTAVALAIIIFCEITPKVIGATFPEKIALPASYILKPLMTAATPFVWVINLVVGRLLKLMRIDTSAPDDTRLSTEELRSVILEGGHFMPHKPRAILVNLFDLEHINVDDVMTPRNRVEALNIATSEDGIREQLVTCYHNKLPVYEGEINRVIGVLHVRRALGLIQREDFTAEDVRGLLIEPYFVPSGTPVFTQLQFFQEQRQRLALVVDEYGEVLGLITLEDIIEEIIGEFTTSTPGGGDTLAGWGENAEIQVEGTTPLRELNRRLGTRFPLEGPRTLSGLVLEELQELPDGDVSVRLGDVVIEVTQMQDRTIRSLKIKRLASATPEDEPAESMA